jgi:hypothetical protein
VQVLLCDGIVGLASTDGAKKPDVGSSALDARRTLCHPSRHSNWELSEKRSISGRDYCGAGLEGGGMKRKLLLQPELREAIARLSQDRPKDERLAQRLSKAEFGALLDGLAHEDPRIVKRFGPDGAEGPLSEDGRRRVLVEQRPMVRDRNLAVFELLTGIQADFDRRGWNPHLWESWIGEWTELLYSLGAHDSDEDLIGSGALHVIRKLLLGGQASLEDRRELGRDAPILRRLLDAYGGLTFPAFFMRMLHQLYMLGLLARGATGFEAEGRLGWVHEAIYPFDKAVALLTEGRVRPLTIEKSRQLDEARALADELLAGVERLEHRINVVVPVISRGCAAGSHTCMSGTLCRSYLGAVPLCAGPVPGKMVGTCCVYGMVLPASRPRRSAIHRQSLRQQIGGVEVPGMIDAPQSVRHTVGSHHCRSLMRWLPVIASGRHLRLPVLNTVGTLVSVRSAAVINACGS